MITVSSNLTTNLLYIDALGIDRIRASVTALGAAGMDIRRKVEDGPAFRAGQNNTTTAAGLAALLEAIRDGRAGSPASTRETDRHPGATDVQRRHPCGSAPGNGGRAQDGDDPNGGIHHDAGIVYGDAPFVLVVMTRGIETEAASDALIASITRRDIHRAVRAR